MNCLRLLSGLLCALYSITVFGSQHSNDLPDRLKTGVVLYSLYQEDYFNALILSPNASTEERRLNRALAMAQFGLANEAKELYKQLVESGSSSSKGIAFFELGKMAYAAGSWGQALKLLGQGEKLVRGDQLSELRYYQASAQIKLSKYNKAAEILENMKKGGWAAYAYYNLAMAYADIDRDPTRSIMILRISEALNSNDTAQLAELRDQALLAAGYLSVQADDYQKALTFLNKVRVDSDLASKALYMHGVANSFQDQYRSAIQSWYRVKKYPLISSGVAEAFMAIPYGYDKEGYSSKAISSYLEAISVFDKETRNIDTVIATVKENGVRKAFFEKSSLDDLEWFLSDSVATNTPKVAYLKYIMSLPELHQLAKRSIELEQLYQNLTLWEYNLTVYRKMLNERISGYYKRIKNADVASKKAKVDGITEQANRLKKRLEIANKEEDFVGVSAGKTLNRFRSVEELIRRLDKLSTRMTERQYNDLKQRLKRLEGLVKWEAKEQYERNIRLTKESIRSLDREMERYKESLTAFESVVSKGPTSLKEFKRRSSEMMQRVKDKKDAVSKVREKHNKLLTEEVLKLLAIKKTEFTAYHQKAQQRLAHLYEYVAMKQDAKVIKAKGGVLQ